ATFPGGMLPIGSACRRRRPYREMLQTIMNRFRTFSALLFSFAFACTGNVPSDESDLLFDGSSKDGWSSAGDDTIRIEIATDSSGNEALSVTGQEASNATFSLAIAPGAAAGTVGIRFRIR